MNYIVTIENSNTGTMYFEEYNYAKIFFDCTCLGIKPEDNTNVFLMENNNLKWTVLLSRLPINVY